MKYHAGVASSGWVDRSEMIMVEDLANRLSDNHHPFKLSFPEPIEYYFRHFYAQISLNRQRIALLLPMAWFFASGLIDFLVMKGPTWDIWQFRLICLAVLSGFFALTYTLSFQYFRPLALFLYSLGVVLSCLSIGVLTEAPYSLVYHLTAGWLVLFLFNALCFMLTWALGLSACTLILANIYWLGFDWASTEMWLFLNFNLVFALSLGITACYFKELEQRKVFLQWEQTKLNRINQEELEFNQDRLPYLVALDSLTGLANKKSFDRTLNGEWKRSLRKHYPISLVEINCQHIKQGQGIVSANAINKHLCDISQKIRGFTRRPGDVACRFEESGFMLLLADTENHNAGMVAEKILSVITTLELAEGNKVGDHNCEPHFSVGVATMIPNGHQSVRDIINMVNQATSLAEKKEPNQFVCVNQLGSYPS